MTWALVTLGLIVLTIAGVCAVNFLLGSKRGERRGFEVLPPKEAEKRER